LRGRGYAPSTIETVFNYLLLTTANTKHTRHKANWARRLYHEWERAKHKQKWLQDEFMRGDNEGRNDD